MSANDGSQMICRSLIFRELTSTAIITEKGPVSCVACQELVVREDIPIEGVDSCGLEACHDILRGQELREGI